MNCVGLNGSESVDVVVELTVEGVELQREVSGHRVDQETSTYGLFQPRLRLTERSQRLATKTGILLGGAAPIAFGDIGGDQSFALALLDGKNSGIVISSLHTREGTRIYSKPIIKGESEKYTLTEEEKQAIKTATIIKATTV